MTRRHYTKCVTLGLLDGIETRGGDLSMGSTFLSMRPVLSSSAHVIYDRCVNLGERIGRRIAQVQDFIGWQGKQT